MTLPNVGDFGVVRTNGLPAALIRFGTRSTVNHAFVYVGDGKIVEAQPSGATLSDVGNYPAAIWSSLNLADNDRASIAHWATQQIGTPYSWADIAALAFACYGISNRWVNQRIERMDRLICSQLCDKAYMLAGVHLFDDGRLTQSVTPGDLLNLIDRPATPRHG